MAAAAASPGSPERGSPIQLRAFDFLEEATPPADIPPVLFNEGWRQHTSARSGKVFYFNIRTQESRYNLPIMYAVNGASVPQPEQDSPDSPSPSPAPPAEAEVPDNDDHHVAGRFHIGGKRYVVVKLFKGQTYVNIREYWRPKDKVTGRLFAGKKGINLKVDQWLSLASMTRSISKVVNTLRRKLH